MISKLKISLLFLLVSMSAHAQFLDSTMGLMQCPSAEMQPSGTFMIYNNYINKNALPSKSWWGHDTFAYGFNITFLDRVEVAYICTLVKGKDNGYWPKQTWGKFCNQDRHFAARLQVLKQGEIWSWTPSIVLGVSDPISGNHGDYFKQSIISDKTNGYFNKVYIAATRQFHTAWGDVGAHVGYQYNTRKTWRLRRPCGAITWNPVWLNRPDGFLTSFRLIAEYDSRTFNLGLTTSVWNDHFEAMAEWQNLKWFNAGLRYKVIIK